MHFEVFLIPLHVLVFVPIFLTVCFSGDPDGDTYSRPSLSRFRLSRINAYLEEKI